MLSNEIPWFKKGYVKVLREGLGRNWKETKDNTTTIEIEKPITATDEEIIEYISMRVQRINAVIAKNIEEAKAIEKAQNELLKIEVIQETRKDQKAVAKRVMENSKDISCDDIAKAFGLSKHTVRGMSKGGRSRKGKQELTNFNREEILATQEE